MKQLLLFLVLLYAVISETNAQIFNDLTDVSANVTAITAHGNVAANPASLAFDNNYDCSTTYSWDDNANASSGSPSWIKVHFSSGKVLKAYSITVNNGSSRNADPTTWTFRGSNNNSSWTTLDTRNSISFGGPARTRFFSFSNSISYTYYQLNITETKQTTSTDVIIAEMQLIDDLSITGYVFKDNGDAAYGKGSNDTAFSGVKVSIVDYLDNVVTTKTTDAAGKYTFSSSDLTNTNGDFSIIVTPPSNYVFVSELPVMFRSGFSLPSHYYNAPCGAVLFACDNNASGNNVMVNRFLFGQGSYDVSSLDFGLRYAIPATLVVPKGYAFIFPQTNLITAANHGTFGTWNPSFPQDHPTRPGFTDGTHSEIFTSISTVSGYTFNAGTSTPSGGTLYTEGDYNTTSFFGTIQDIASGKSGSYQGSLENDNSGGWLKSYGATTGDSYDLFEAINGATVGTTPFFTQSGLSLTSNEEYLLTFNAKGANSYVQAQNGLGVNPPAIIVEVTDNSGIIIYSATKTFGYSVSTAQDLPNYQWDQVTGVFKSNANGPFKITLRATTGIATGNDAYIDNISLYHLRRVDYGDAPSSYGTAYNLIISTLRIGSSTPDSNRNAKNSYYADADDKQGSDDEDGVAYFPPLTSSTTSYSIAVSVTNSTGSTATLGGWVDFNGNGVFNASEGVLVSVANGFSGTKTLNWTTSNPTHITYGRFRISTDAMTTASATGRLNDGETEDYYTSTYPAPIELLSFSAVLNENKSVDLNWATASEMNSDHFTILRSSDGRNWEPIADITAAGYSGSELNYSATDKSPLSGTSYYQLRETDFDGTTTYSELQEVYLASTGVFTLNILGNLVSNQLNYTLSGSNTNTSVKVVDMNGNIKMLSTAGHDGTFTIQTSALSAGNYFLTASAADGQVEVKRFVVYQ